MFLCNSIVYILFKHLNNWSLLSFTGCQSVQSEQIRSQKTIRPVKFRLFLNQNLSWLPVKRTITSNVHSVAFCFYVAPKEEKFQCALSTSKGNVTLHSWYYFIFCQYSKDSKWFILYLITLKTVLRFLSKCSHFPPLNSAKGQIQFVMQLNGIV